jgi:NAD(P)H-dependent flavin oxidoreductase YrpB (nitropropane dioxygenase family)
MRIQSERFEGRPEGVVMLLDHCQVPVVLAPLAGGPSTPELCAAVSDAAGLGFLAVGYLSASELATRIERTRRLTNRPSSETASWTSTPTRLPRRIPRSRCVRQLPCRRIMFSSSVKL